MSRSPAHATPTRLLGLLCAATALSQPAQAQDEPFALQTIELGRGIRVLEVHPARITADAGGQALDLLVVTAQGLPPEEERRLMVFPAGGAALTSAEPRHVIPVPADVVAFDLADVDPAPGEEVVLLGPRGLALVDAARPGSPRPIKLAKPVALAPRVRGVGRLEFVADWHGDGRAAALIPELDGARLVRLDSGESTHHAFPILAVYETGFERPPPEGLLRSRFSWPDLILANDDADARPDLFAVGRYRINVFRAADGGLPGAPSRTLAVPTTEAAELRPEASAVTVYVRDLDGDGLGDIVVHRTGGTLVESHASVDLHRNAGDGAVLADPEVHLEVSGSFGGLEIADLDGNGRPELIEWTIQLGVVQVVRLLVTQRARVSLRVLELVGPGIAGVRTSWREGVSLPLDFGKARVVGILPTPEGDWNGDGRLDLLYSRGAGELAIHLGVVGESGPGFGARVAAQRVPAAGETLVADLDGDGLDDLVLFDPRDPGGALHVLHNRGVLPGTPPRFDVAPRETASGG